PRADGLAQHHGPILGTLGNVVPVVLIALRRSVQLSQKPACAVVEAPSAAFVVGQVTADFRIDRKKSRLAPSLLPAVTPPIWFSAVVQLPEQPASAVCCKPTELIVPEGVLIVRA